jgi:hypothetical protein
MWKHPLNDRERTIEQVFADSQYRLSSADNQKVIEFKHTTTGRFAYFNREAKSIRVWLDPRDGARAYPRLPSGVTSHPDVGWKSSLTQFEKTKTKVGRMQHFGATFECVDHSALKSLLAATQP